MAITFSPEVLDEMMAMGPFLPYSFPDDMMGPPIPADRLVYDSTSGGYTAAPPPVVTEAAPVTPKSNLPSDYWSWDDPRYKDWGASEESLKYPINDIWDKVLRKAGFSGEIYQPITETRMNEYGGWDDYQVGTGYTQAAKSAIDQLRSQGIDVVRKHPDRRTFNTYWGLVTPEGVEDIKVAGSDLGEGLRAMVPYISLLAGPLGAQIGGALGGALGVTSTLGQQALGSAIVNAGLTAASGADFGDVLRSGVTGLVTPYVPGVVGDIVPKSLGALESVAEKAITSAATSAISGKGDPAAAALGSLAGSAVGAIPGATSVPPAIMQGALELATTGSLSPSTLFNAATSLGKTSGTSQTGSRVGASYDDPLRTTDVVAELGDTIGTPSGGGTLVAGPMDFSAPNRAEQKTQVADYIRNQAENGVAGFKVGPGGVLEVEDRDRGVTHRFTSDGSVLGSVDTVFGSRTGEASSTSASVKDFLESPYVQGLFQGGEGSGDGGRYMVSEVAEEGPATGSLTQEQSDELLKQAEQDLMEEELYQVNSPVTLPSTDVDTTVDSGQSVFDQIDQDLGQLALDRQEETRAEQDQEQARKDAEAAEYEQFRLQQEFEQQGQPAATEIVQPPVAEIVQEPVQEPVVIPPSPVVDQPVQVQEESAVLPPTTVAQEQAQEAIQPPVQPSTGVGPDEVRQIVSDALQANPSLTEQQVQQIVNGAIQNMPAGLTTQDVAQVVDDAISRLPQGPTTADIDSAVNRAMTDVATKSDVADAIRNIQFPEGINQEDVSRAISDYMEQNPGLTASDVAQQVEQALQQLPVYATPSDVDAAVRSGLTGYATSQDVAQLGGNLQAQVQNLNQDLQFAISDAIASGLQGDAALREGLETLAGNLGTTRSELLSRLGASEETLRSELASQLGGVSSQISNVQTLLLDKINAAYSVGLQGDEALRAGLDSLAADLGTTQANLLSQLGTTEAALRSQFGSQIGEVRTQVGQLGQDLQAAIDSARRSGLQGDAALQAGLDTLAGSLGTTRSELLSQLGTTEQALRLDFASQLGGVQSQVTQLGSDLSSAIESARAAGLQGDAALQAGLDTLANRLNTTTDQLLSQLGATEQGLRDQFAGQLGEVESSLTGQIGGLRQDVQEQYDMLTAAQQAEVERRVQQGQDLTRAISDVSSVLSGEIAGVQAGLTGQIGGLRQEMAEQYEMLSDAQQAEVARRVQQGENLEAAIGSVASSLGERLTGVESGLTQQIGGVEERLNSRIEDLVNQGVDFQTATNQALKEVTGGLETLSERQQQGSEQTQTAIGSINDRIDQLMQQGLDWQDATNQAIAEVSGSVSGLAEETRQQAAEQRSATEAAVARAVQQATQDAAARDAARQAAADDQSRRQQLMTLASSFASQGTGSGVSDPYKATFLQPFIVGGKGPEKFEGPLSGFLKQATTGDFLPDKPQQSTRLEEDQQVSADQYFGNAQALANPLDVYQPEQEYTGLFGFRAGGMVPFMAQGGTRYGHNAHGALNVLEHSGKHRVDYRQGDAVTGIGDGQSDDIPAMLADGEFVIPADVVAALGNGSTKAGSDKLYEMMHNIRRHHRSAGPKDLPPPAKAPLEYIKSRKGRSA